jgi:hypothetical protein
MMSPYWWPAYVTDYPSDAEVDAAGDAPWDEDHADDAIRVGNDLAPVVDIVTRERIK